MRRVNLILGLIALAAAQQVIAAAAHRIPDSCPVTRATPETRFTPPLPSASRDFGDASFWFGTHALFTHLSADGRWRGQKSSSGTRNKLFIHRKNPEWLMEHPHQLVVTALRLDGDQRMINFPRINNAIMGKEVAMLLMLELPEAGCWQVTANYKSDSLAFVTWVD
jgi:hypothetical protein